MTGPDAGALLRGSKRILVMVRQHIGDVVNSTAAIHAIRQNCPSAFIGVSVGEKAAGVLDNSPDFDALILRPWKRDLRSKLPYILQLRKGHFDVAIILDEVGSQARNARFAGIKTVVGISLESDPKDLDAWVMFDESVHDTRGQCSALLSFLGFDVGVQALHLYPSAEDEAHVGALLNGLAGPLVAVHPGASERTRRWLPDRFAAVVAKLSSDGVTVLLTGSDSEMELCQEVASLSGADPLVLAGKLSILQFAALCKRLQTLVVGDTGPTHTAGAMGTRVVALFGPTFPEKTGPAGAGHSIIVGDCSCGRRSWETCSYACMESIGVERVLAAVREQSLAAARLE